MIVKVLNTIDYSIVNELCRIDRPSVQALLVGQSLHYLLDFVSDSMEEVCNPDTLNTITW